MSADGKPARGRTPDFVGVALKIIFTLSLATAMWWMVWAVVGATGGEGAAARWLPSLFVPAAVALVIGLLLLRTEQHWARPSRELVSLLEQIRAGEAPIESLQEMRGGGLGSHVVPLVQQILVEARQQKQAMAELNEEIRQRIASRTDALERQIGSLKQQATRDALTGLHNRRLLDAYLPPLIERCAADRMDLSVLMIDVDHFKTLNDTLGHGAGDELLRNIAQILRSGIREQDTAFRVGGDEFVVVLPGAPPQVAEAIGARMKSLVDALGKQSRLACHPTLSVGVWAISQMRVPGAVQLLLEADRKLYEAKASRKRVVARAG